MKIIVFEGPQVLAHDIKDLVSIGVSKLKKAPPGEYPAEIQKRPSGAELLVIRLGGVAVGCGAKGWENQGVAVKK
jgi:hypothetical protein